MELIHSAINIYKKFKYMYIIYTGTKNKSSIRWHPVNPLGQQYLQEIYTVHCVSKKNCEFSFKMLIF